MSLVDLMRKGGLRAIATATPATVATHEAESAATVAEVATVTVAGLPDGQTDSDQAPDLDRWCWPHSNAMSSAEIRLFTLRLAMFIEQGLTLADAEVLADRLVTRDREGDDRRLCLECAHLSGRRCAAWRLAALGGPVLSTALLALPQRCAAFDTGRTKEDVAAHTPRT